MEGAAGVIAIDINVAFVIVRFAVPTCPRKTAEMVAVPAPSAVARPKLPDALLIVAIDDVDEVHVTAPVKSC